MTDITNGEVEILVHVAAPSRGQDDAKYRALAQAYLDFEAVERRNLLDVPIVEQQEISGLDRIADTQLHDELLATQEYDSQASYRPDDEPERQADITRWNPTSSELLRRSNRLGSKFFGSLSLSFNSALDNADSPAFRKPPTKEVTISISQSEVSDSADSWKPPPSEVPDSQPSNYNTTAAHDTPTRVLELYLLRQQYESSQEQSFCSNRREQNTHISESAGAADKSEDHPPVQEPEEANAISIPETTRSPARSHAAESDHRHLHKQITEQESSVAIPSQEPQAGATSTVPPSFSPPPRRAHTDPTLLTASSSRSRKRQREEDGDMDTSRKVPRSSPPRSLSDPISKSSMTESNVWEEKLEIRPPAPRSSLVNLTSDHFITEKLLELATKMPLDKLYRPAHQSRELRPMERGYWLVQTESWEPKVQRKCWNFLGKCVGQGLVGWGVSCIRDEEFRTLRVNCWGSIVGNIYLLLYTASLSKIKLLGADWIDGDGETVISMKL